LRQLETSLYKHIVSLMLLGYKMAEEVQMNKESL